MDTMEPDERTHDLPRTMLTCGSAFVAMAIGVLVFGRAPGHPETKPGMAFSLFGAGGFFLQVALRMKADEPWSLQVRLADGLLSWGMLVAFLISFATGVLRFRVVWTANSRDIFAAELFSIVVPITAYVVRRKIRRVFSNVERSAA